MISKYLLSLTALGLSVFPATAQNVTTYKYDNALSGLNPAETVLKPGNVNVATFGQLFTCAIDGQAYAQPLYLSQVNVAGKGVHNVVYVATCHDSVYAFDADKAGDPLWLTSFISPAVGQGITSVPQDDVISGDVNPEIGIMSTPVIDAATGTLYVVSKTKETGRGDNHTHYVQKLHALDVTTGAEKMGGPKVIGDITCDNASDRKATYDYNLKDNPLTPGAKGMAKDAIEGVVYLNALRANQRPSLTLANGVVYITWSSHGDNSPYHGWVIGYGASTLEPIPNGIFCVTPDGSDGGIWQSGAGAAIDSANNLYFTTANGELTGYKGGKDWSQAVMRFALGSGLSTEKLGQTFDYFSPHDEQSLSNGDVDLGSGGTVPIDVPGAPTPHLLIASGKSGIFYVLNRDSLGQFNAQTNNIVQELEQADRKEVMSTPVFFNNTLYYNKSGQVLKTRAFVNGKFADETNETDTSFNGRGGGPVISSNGKADGIVWMLNNGGPADLEAYSADALAAAPTGQRIPALFKGRMPDGGVKFTHPVVVNGKVYGVCASRKDNTISSAHLCVFGLLNDPSVTAKPATPTQLEAVSNTPLSVTLRWKNDDHTANGFYIKRSTGDSTDLTLIDTAGATANSYTDKTVTGATTYHYVIAAVNGVGASDDSTPVKVDSHPFITADGLVAYWSFDESTGQTANDLTGKGHNGALGGEVTWSQGIQNSPGIEFHGTGNAISRVVVKDQPDLNFSKAQSFTLVAWARPASKPARWSAVVAKARAQASGWYGIYTNPDNKWSFRGADASGNLSGGKVQPNKWQQIGAVQDGAAGTRTLYVDGVSVATSQVTQDANAPGLLWIGQGDAEDEGFSGNIDDVRVFNRALTPQDIQALGENKK